MARERKNLTFSPEILERASAVMRARGFDELSDFISTLIREEYERRHPPQLAPGAPAGTPTARTRRKRPGPVPDPSVIAEHRQAAAEETAKLARPAAEPAKSATHRADPGTGNK